MDQPITSRLEADLFLLHAPSVYDFRERDDMLFAYLSDSDSVNVIRYGIPNPTSIQK